MMNHRTPFTSDRGGRFSSSDQGSSFRSRRRPGQGNRADDDDAFDYQADRKRRRREAKKAEKDARIAAHARWTEQKRALRARVADDRTAAKNEIQSAQPAKERKRSHTAEPPSTSPARCAQAGRAAHRPTRHEADVKRARCSESAEPTDGSVGPKQGHPVSSPIVTRAVTVVPAVVKERIRRCVNKLTLSNVVDLTHEISDLFLRSHTLRDDSSSCTSTPANTAAPVISRATVAAGLMQEMARRCNADAGPLTLTDTLSLAGLLRGMQLLHGMQLGAELIEQLCMNLDSHVRRAEEGPGDNTVTVLAQLYLLYGVDADFILSLLNYLVDVASGSMQLHQAAQSAPLCTSAEPTTGRASERGILRRAGETGKLQSKNSGSVSTTDSVNAEELLGEAAAAHAVALAATSCALALLRACGDKLLREAGAGLEQALQRARHMVASKSSPNYNNSNDSNSSRSSAEDVNTTSSAKHTPLVGSARCAALVSVMADIAAGRTHGARRSAATESEAPVAAMLQHLCALLPGAAAAASSRSTRSTSTQTTAARTLRRVVQTHSVLTGISWRFMVQPVKPARWFDSSVSNKAMDKPRARVSHGTDASERSEEDSDSQHCSSSSSSSSSDSDDESKRVDAAREARRREIHCMREREKAIAGQRFHTEHKREIFQCVISAADDLDCFNALVQYDPSYTRFSDVCAVLLQCCYQEGRYNNYYTQILERFCSARPACVKTLQFAIWDRIKSIRIDGVDVTGYVNLSCLMATLLEHGTFHLSLLRGLDLADTNKTLSLFARVLLLRVVLQLPSARLTELFFGGDGWKAHDVRTDTADLRRCLTSFVKHYFMDDAVAGRWVPLFYDVVAMGTSFQVGKTPEACSAEEDEVVAGSGTEEDKLQQFMTRLNVIYKALRKGIM